MAFDYEKVRDKVEDDLTGHWASYSDLFTLLSMIFLMCYVVTKLHSTGTLVNQRAEVEKISRENEDLREQIKVYSTLREDYLKNGASEGEQKVYNELMDKLALLQEQAKEEKQDLRKQASENEKKELALNKYQQLIRNIINANLVASSRIKTRDQMIDKKDTALVSRQRKINSLRSEVGSLEQTIDENKERISEVEQQLSERRKQLAKSLKEHQISETKFKASMAKLEQQSKNEIGKLKEENSKVAGQLANTHKDLNEAQKQLEATSAKAENYAKAVVGLEKERENLQGQTRALASEAKNLKGQTDALRGETAALRGQADALRGEANALRGEKKNLEAQKSALQGDYARVAALANARRDLASKIINNFRRAGINADVDAKTGDVTISFGNEYFDTGKSDLKPRMTNIIQQTIPVYSASLFEDERIAKKIKAVEIIGFASPTYKGKYVDPASLDAENRPAVNFNMDLSYYRARAIFDYIFDPNKINYQNQKRLLPLVKVTGRSYLAEKKERDPASGETDAKDYCNQFDCKKAQKVIIKFNLGE